MKKIFSGSIGVLLIGLSGNSNAALASNAVLLFDPSVEGCSFGGTLPSCNGFGTQIVGGTFFSFDINGNGNIELSERIGMSAFEGVKIGTAQPASGSHFGFPDGTESPSIDQPWSFFGNTGMHLTTSPVTIANDDGAGNVLLDMSGWGIIWNGIPTVSFGSGSWGSNPEGQAVLTCAVDCSVGDSFTLYYTATVPIGDPSGFGGVRYRLGFDGGTGAGAAVEGNFETVSFADDDNGAILSGTIGAASVVPVPAAVWLFGSGLLGLIGVARRKR